MAKNKSKQTQPQQLSPEKYIRLKGRNLPIEECFISEGWETAGQAEVVVTRRHAGGTFTLAMFLVDTFCLGIKDAFCKFNLSSVDYEDFKDCIDAETFEKASYEEAHNLIYGALSYAEELGIKPAKGFELAQYLLEEDTDDIPLIEYEFGKDGRPCLYAENRLMASQYVPLLEEATGGDYELKILDEEDEDEFDDEDYEPLFKDYPSTPYTYQQPEYPTELKLTHQAALGCLLNPPADFLLPTEDIDAILALPRETLIDDLRQILLYAIGEELESRVLIHVLFFLGELRAEEALNEVLEVLRQSPDFLDEQFEDLCETSLLLTLYYVGRNKLPELLAFLKEPGLYEDFRFWIFAAVNYVADEPGRREEVIEWYREVFNFCQEHAEDLSLYSPELGGLMIAELLDISPEELLPDIEQLYKRCKIAIRCCGDFETVKEDTLAHEEPLRERKQMDIYERYQEYYNEWVS